MKTKLIEILIVVVALFVLGFVVGCEKKPEYGYGYVMSEIHFWDETCQKEIVGSTIQPTCYFLCSTCSNIYSVDPERNVSVLGPRRALEVVKQTNERYKGLPDYQINETKYKDLIHEQEIEIIEPKYIWPDVFTDPDYEYAGDKQKDMAIADGLMGWGILMISNKRPDNFGLGMFKIDRIIGEQALPENLMRLSDDITGE